MFRLTVTPRLFVERLNVEDLNEERISWLGALDRDRTREVVNLGQVEGGDVVG